MRAFIGSKIILAEPMSEFEFKRYVKKEVTGDAIKDRPGYHVVYPDDYHSWSPKNVFEEAYRELGSGEIAVIRNGEVV